MAGVDLEEIDAPTTLSVLFSMIVDDVTYSEVPRAKARERVLEVIKEQSVILEFEDTQRRGESARATWGTAPEHQQGVQAAMSFVGGPAGPPPQ